MDPELMKHVFIASYFDLDTREHLPDVVKKFLLAPEEDHIKQYLDYLAALKLRNVVIDNSADVFRFVKPQFKFVCEREYDLDLVKFNYGGVFLRKGAVVYATNLFVPDPGRAIALFLNVVNSTGFVAEGGEASLGDKHIVWNGTDGILFARAYTDWQGLKVCKGTKFKDDEDYRMYIIGETLAQKFVEKNIAHNDVGVLKNYYKGTPLKYTDNLANVINQKGFITNNVDVVFENFAEEFEQRVDYIKFVQRDYIYDADDFNDDLLEELQKHYVSLTSVYKIINRFHKSSIPNVGHELVVDRYATNKYKKMIVTGKFELPRREDKLHIFIPKDFLQLRHTLNAAYVPDLGIVILAEHAFFGASRVLNFNPKTDLYVFVKSKNKIEKNEMYYHIGGDYYLEETMFAANNVPVFVIVRIDKDLLVRDNLRTSRNLRDLKHNWVNNTILNLFVKT